MSEGKVNVRPWVWVGTGVGAVAALVSTGTLIDTLFGGLIWFFICLVIDRVVDRLREKEKSGGSAQNNGRRFVCETCKAEVSEAMKFCPSCGTESTTKSTPPFCSNCGVPSGVGAQFCKECGKSLSGVSGDR